MAAKEEGEKRQKGWYRYKLRFGATRTGGHYECELMLQKRGKTNLEDFPREEAENILRQIANYMAKNADFANLTEDF
jgi:hypothetical protein